MFEVRSGQDDVMRVLLAMERISTEDIFHDDRRVLGYSFDQAFGYVGVEDASDAFVIHFIVITPSHRGSGHGTQFLQMIERLAADSSFECVIVATQLNSRFFRERGFQEVNDGRLVKRIVQA